MHGSGSLKWDPWIKFERGLLSSDMFALSDSRGSLCWIVVEGLRRIGGNSLSCPFVG